MDEIRELRNIYYRIYQEALLNENEARIAYYEGYLDGLNSALSRLEYQPVEIILEGAANDDSGEG